MNHISSGGVNDIISGGADEEKKSVMIFKEFQLFLRGLLVSNFEIKSDYAALERS